MPASNQLSLSALAARLCAAGALLSSSGCLSQSYEVSIAELEQLVQLPADERGARVRVTQQTSLGSEVSEDEAVPTENATDLAVMVSDDQHPHRHHHHRHHSDSQGDTEGDAAQALAAAVVVAAAAATAAVTLGITEGARFDGWAQVPGDHPLLLIEASGRRRWTQLQNLSAADLRHVDRAVLPDFAAELQRLERHRLDRTGFVYQLEFGAEPAAIEGPPLAVSGRGGLGFMPAQRYGFLLGAAFSTARRDEPPNAGGPSSTLSFEHRVFLQTEAWPLWAGRWHLGPYAELGYAWAAMDDPLGSRAADGPMVAAGAALQLECSTRLAVTLRAGAAWLPVIGLAAMASDAGVPGSHRLTPGLTLGVSIY